jgi:PAS domain S-box-containing protein
MTIEKGKDVLPAQAKLRIQAEERLRKKSAELHLPRTVEETQRLVHEFEVHQIELEIQQEELHEANEKVEALLEKYTDLYDFAPVGYFTLTRAGAISTVNFSGASFLGIERILLLGRRFGLYVAEEDRHRFADFLEKVFVNQGKESCEVTLTREGNCSYFVKIEAVSYASGAECRFAVVDITERRRSEEPLRESESKFSKAFQATPSILVISSLEDDTYKEVNEAFEHLLGYRRSEVIGRSSLDLNIWENPGDRVRTIQLLTEGRKIRDQEIVLRRKSGELLFGLYSAEIIEIHTEKCLISLVNDVTERRKAEAELRRSEERYHSLYIDTPGMLHSIDHDGCLVSVSNYWLETLGYERSEVLGRVILEFLTAESRSYATKIVLPEFFRTGFCTEVPYQFVKKNGQILDVRLSAIAERDSEGNIIRSLAVMIDVTESKRTLEALSFSEARYRALFRDNPTMIVTLDADLTMLSVNPFCASQLGYMINELEGSSVLELFHEDDRPVVSEQLRTCLQNPNHVYHWQIRKICKDGGTLWVEETAQTVSDLNGTPNILIVCQDITRRKRTEEERERLFFKLEAVLENINEGVVISDLKGNVLTMNKEALTLHEFESMDQVSRLISEYQDTFELFDFDGGTVPLDKWPLYRVLQGERFNDWEVCVRRKDTGKLRIWSYSGTPVRNKAGDIILSVITVRDVTERKKAATALQKSEKKFFKIFHSVPALIGVSSLDEGRFIDVNQASLQTLGYQREEIIGKTAFELGLWEDESVRVKVMQTIKEQGSIQNKEIRFKGKNGQILTGLYSAELIDIDEDRYLLNLVKDITDRKYAEEAIESLNAELAARATALEDVNHELETFNYTAAHDLRQPLNVISSYCQIINELCGAKLDEQCRRYIQETYDGTQRMSRLIETLLDFSRLVHAELNQDKVDLSSMAKEVVEELKGPENKRRVDVRIAEGIVANADANLLRVVLANLLGNAWKYTVMREDAEIEFGLTNIYDKPVYFVRDNGTGFNMADANLLFAPFKCLPGDEECRGFGIGLATVERIIRRHGGKVWAESEPGKGATFYFTLSATGSLTRVHNVEGMI